MRQTALLMFAMLGVAPLVHAQDGSSCATATQIFGGQDLGQSYTADTTAATNWMTSFGPLVSPSNDLAYFFVVGQNVTAGHITPTASNYAFALYMLPSCSDSGTEPVPIGATATVGSGIDIVGSGGTPGGTYYLAVTGTAAGGPSANGTVTFNIQTNPVTLQSFTVE